MRPGSRFLTLAAIACFLIAALHVVLIFIGPPAYRYFDAGEQMASMDEAGSILPDLLTMVITAVFTIFGMYGLSGAGNIRRLPLLKIGLVAIASVYTLRGLALFVQIALMVVKPETTGFKHLVFSFVSLAVGIAFLAGIRKAWPELTKER